MGKYGSSLHPPGEAFVEKLVREAVESLKGLDLSPTVTAESMRKGKGFTYYVNVKITPEILEGAIRKAIQKALDAMELEHVGGDDTDFEYEITL